MLNMRGAVSDEKFMVRAQAVRVTEDVLSVDLEDGRTISVPLVWYPRLVHGTARERSHFEVSPFGIHWPDLDEDISVKGLLVGQKSGESPESLKFWLEQRARGHTPTLEEWSRAKAKRGRGGAKVPPVKVNRPSARRTSKRKAS
jgi:hypothetical protein